MSRRATPVLIEDIWEAIEKIERYVSGLDHDAFIKDDKTVDSVVRNLEIIGEAANRINLVDVQAKPAQSALLEIAHEKPEKTLAAARNLRRFLKPPISGGS
jgi:uncharacterized protein with HEPN domain